MTLPKVLNCGSMARLLTGYSSSNKTSGMAGSQQLLPMHRGINRDMSARVFTLTLGIW